MDGAKNSPGGPVSADSEGLEAILNAGTWEQRLADARARRERILQEKGRPTDSFFERRGPKPWERPRDGIAVPGVASGRALPPNLPPERLQAIEARLTGGRQVAAPSSSLSTPTIHALPSQPAPPLAAERPRALADRPEGPAEVPVVPFPRGRAAERSLPESPANPGAAVGTPLRAPDAEAHTSPARLPRATLFAAGVQAGSSPARQELNRPFPTPSGDSPRSPATRKEPLFLDIGMAEAIRDGRAETLRPVPAARRRSVTPLALLVGFSIGLGIGIGLTAAASIFGRYFPPEPQTAVPVAAAPSFAASDPAAPPLAGAAVIAGSALTALAPAPTEIPALRGAEYVKAADPAVARSPVSALPEPPEGEVRFAPPRQNGAAPFRLASPVARFAIAAPSAVAALAPEPAARLPGPLASYTRSVPPKGPVAPNLSEPPPTAAPGTAPLPVALAVSPGLGLLDIPVFLSPFGDNSAQPPFADAGLLAVTRVPADLPPSYRSPEPGLADALRPAERPVAAFPGVTLLLMAPESAAAPADLADLTAVLAAAGFAATETRPTGFVIRRDNVRYYHPEDRASAEAAALALGAELRDFTGSGAGPPAGRIEIWLKSPGALAPAAKPAKAAKPAAAARPAQVSQPIIEQALRDRIISGLRARGP